MRPVLPFAEGRLRPLRSDDRARVLALLRAPEVRWFLCDNRILTAAEVGDMLVERRLLEADGLGLWAIEADRAAFAGIVGLEPVSERLREVPELEGGTEPLIALHPRFFGRGLARSALAALIDYARDRLGLPHLVAAVDGPNQRSHRLLKVCGFRPVGQVEGHAHMLTLYKKCLRSTVPD